MGEGRGGAGSSKHPAARKEAGEALPDPHEMISPVLLQFTAI